MAFSLEFDTFYYLINYSLMYAWDTVQIIESL